MARLTAEDLIEAMAGHPPIGRQARRPDLVARATPACQEASELKAGCSNGTWPGTGSDVFLICATGAAAGRCSTLKARIGNSAEQEREIVRTELGKINRTPRAPRGRRNNA